MPNPEGEEARECARLTAALPEKVGDGFEKREVQPESPLLAAWGTPAIVLRCGVGTPASYRPGTDLTVVNNVGWYGDERADDVVYTAITREPRVAVAVPRNYGSSFELLVDLAPTLAEYTVGPDLTPQ